VSFWSVEGIVESYSFFGLCFLFQSHSVSWVVVTGVGYGITWIQNLFSACMWFQSMISFGQLFLLFVVEDKLSELTRIDTLQLSEAS
jgi:hypothetical protein